MVSEILRYKQKRLTTLYYRMFVCPTLVYYADLCFYGFLNYVFFYFQDRAWTSYIPNHTDIPRLRKGMVGGQFWSAYVDCNAQFKVIEFKTRMTTSISSEEQKNFGWKYGLRDLKSIF